MPVGAQVPDWNCPGQQRASAGAGGLGDCRLLVISPKAASALPLRLQAHKGWARGDSWEARAVPGSQQLQ